MSEKSPHSFFASISPSWQFAVIAFVILRGFYALWSSVILAVYPLVVQNFGMSNLPVVLTFNLHTSQGAIYLRNVDGQALTFRPINVDFMSDTQTGSIWNVKTGESVNGLYEGKSLVNESDALGGVLPYFGIEAYPISWFAIWQRYDANWYLSIAEHGYGKVPGDYHFPPLFPLLIWFVSLLTGNTFIAGLLISHLAALFTIKLFYDLFHEWMPAPLAKRAIVYFLVFPTSFFLFSVYSEPIFLVFVLMSMKMIKKKSWIWAGFWTFCAILTRMQAVALIPALLYLIYKDKPFLRKPAHWAGLIFPVIAGLISLFMLIQGGAKYFSPTNEMGSHNYLVPPWESYWYALRTLSSGQASFIDILN
ncbi:MAG: glycosyltransferase family 39 protein, partial [Anaerolineales bacterium]|nr:glycosyltransferase family 39 protein [Anaerolineales bacterium]